MSLTLATQCPSCQTAFRVLREQLQVSEGWVICGRCQSVFNARDHLLAPAQLPSPESMEIVIPPGSEMLVDGVPMDVFLSQPPVWAAGPWPETPSRNTPTPAAPGPQAPGGGSTGLAVSHPSTWGLKAPEVDLSELDLQPDSAPGRLDETRPSRSARERVAPRADKRRPERASEGRRREPTPVPGFLADAERAARWDDPVRRRWLQGGTAALGVLAVGQLFAMFHDDAADAWPGVRPAIGAVCQIGGCTLDAPRRLDSLAVETATLRVVTDDPAATHRLAVTVRNRSSRALAMPALDLTLTGPAGDVIVRRVITANETGSVAGVVPALGEWALQLPLKLSPMRVAAFSVEVFYP